MLKKVWSRTERVGKKYGSTLKKKQKKLLASVRKDFLTELCIVRVNCLKLFKLFILSFLLSKMRIIMPVTL